MHKIFLHNFFSIFFIKKFFINVGALRQQLAFRVGLPNLDGLMEPMSRQAKIYWRGFFSHGGNALTYQRITIIQIVE